MPPQFENPGDATGPRLPPAPLGQSKAVTKNIYDVIVINDFFKRDLNILDLAHIYGFIINKTHKLRCFGIEVPFKQRHWSAVRNMNGCFYDLDSKLDEPKCIGGSEKVLTFLRSEMACQKTELFLVVASLVAETKTWMKVDSDS